MTSMEQPPATKRKAISRTLRFEILRRDNHTCYYCHATGTPLTIDHVVPVALGGTDAPSNLVAACKDCNGGKSSSSPDASTVAQVSDDAIRWSAAVKATADRMRAGDAGLRDRVDTIRGYWDACVPGFRQNQPRYRLPSDWRSMVEGLLVSGLPDEMILDSIDVATSRTNLDQVFRYMLGVANNKLAKLHEEAAKAFAADDAPGPDCGCDPLAYYKGADDMHRRWQGAYSNLSYYALSSVVDAEGWDWRANA